MGKKLNHGKLPSFAQEILDTLNTKIIGQNEAKDALIEAVCLNRSKIRIRNTSGNFLFMGKTGVGKTLLATEFAHALGCSKPLRIDCSELKEPHRVSTLLGTPPGYIGFDSVTPIFSETSISKYRNDKKELVIILDEFEKAHRQFHEFIINLLDSGKVTVTSNGPGKKNDPQSNETDLSSAYIIMTSNIGAVEVKELLCNSIGFKTKKVGSKDVRGTFNKVLTDTFAPELIGRLDKIIIFNDLTKEDLHNMIEILVLKFVNDLYASHRLCVRLDRKLIPYLYDAVPDKEKYGGRNVKRTIEGEIILPFSRVIHKLDISKYNLISIKVGKDGISFVHEDSKDTFAEAYLSLGDTENENTTAITTSTLS